MKNNIHITDKQFYAYNGVLYLLAAILMIINLDHLAKGIIYFENAVFKNGELVALKDGLMSLNAARFKAIIFDLAVMISISLQVKWIEYVFTSYIFIMTFFYYQLHEAVTDSSTFSDPSKFQYFFASMLTSGLYSFGQIILSVLLSNVKKYHVIKDEKIAFKTEEIIKSFGLKTEDGQDINQKEQLDLVLKQYQNQIEQLKTESEQHHTELDILDVYLEVTKGMVYCKGCKSLFTPQGFKSHKHTGENEGKPKEIGDIPISLDALKTS